MISEKASYPKYYPRLCLDVFAPDWYLKGLQIEDVYSNKIISSKNNDESGYFIPKIKILIDDLKSKGYIDRVDVILIIPKSDSTYSKTLESIGEWLKVYLKTKYEKIIERITLGRRNLSGNLAEKRFQQTKDSMVLNRDIKDDEKNFLLVDDTKTTGMTFLECAKILKEKGAENIYCICLGISRNLNKYPLKK